MTQLSLKRSLWLFDRTGGSMGKNGRQLHIDDVVVVQNTHDLFYGNRLEEAVSFSVVGRPGMVYYALKDDFYDATK